MVKGILNLVGTLLFIAALAAAATPALAQSDFTPLRAGETCREKVGDFEWFLCGSVETDGHITYTNTGVHNVTLFTTGADGFQCAPGIDTTDPESFKQCGALQVEFNLHVSDSAQTDVEMGQLVYLARSDSVSSSRTLTAHFTEAPPNVDLGDASPFSESRIFIEFNATTEDMGIRALLDGEPWDAVRIIGPDQRVFQASGGGNLGQLGLTELSFATHEPAREDLSVEDLLALFPEGEYEFRGRTVEGDEAPRHGDLDP